MCTLGYVFQVLVYCPQQNQRIVQIQLMVAVQMGQELLQVLTLKDVMLSAKTVLYHILAAVLMEFLQV